MTVLLSDDFSTSPGPLEGREATTGQTWVDINEDTLVVADGRLVQAAPGSYAEVVLTEQPWRMEATVSWTGSSESAVEDGALVLICSNFDGGYAGVAGTYGAYKNMIHCVIGAWGYSLNYYVGGEASALLDSRTYPGGPCALDGTTYEIGMTAESGLVTVDLPNGEARRVIHPQFREVAGDHLIFQIYKAAAPDLHPGYHSVRATSAPVRNATNGPLPPS